MSGAVDCPDCLISGRAMTKNDLIRKVQESIPHYPPRDLAHAVQVIFDSVAASLKKKERIEIRGWGSFSLRARKGRSGRNPKSGRIFNAPPRMLPFFKAAKELERRINGHDTL